ncbi:MAG: CUAEP/CCAEP-tail radical SAM (seleno)protein, partial [Actinomycetota bacterium]
DPVQYSIRLLLPEGSLLLDHPDMVTYLESYDVERLTYTWRAADPTVDELQQRLARIVEDASDEATGSTFLRIYGEIMRAAGEQDRKADGLIMAGSVEGRPRLTEPWFC